MFKTHPFLFDFYWPLLFSKVGIWPLFLGFFSFFKIFKIIKIEKWPKKVGFWPLLFLKMATIFLLFYS